MENTDVPCYPSALILSFPEYPSFLRTFVGELLPVSYPPIHATISPRTPASSPGSSTPNETDRPEETASSPVTIAIGNLFMSYSTWFLCTPWFRWALLLSEMFCSFGYYYLFSKFASTSLTVSSKSSLLPLLILLAPAICSHSKICYRQEYLYHITYSAWVTSCELMISKFIFPSQIFFMRSTPIIHMPIYCYPQIYPKQLVQKNISYHDC